MSRSPGTDGVPHLSTEAACGLLERATSYTLGSLQAVTLEQLHAPTPCTDWDLRTLLQHLNESLDLLSACLGVDNTRSTDDPMGAFRMHATTLLDAIAHDGTDRSVVIAGRYRMSIGLIAATGAVEIAVHGWDVSRATKVDRPIPCELARDMWEICQSVTVDADQHRLFAPAIPAPPAAALGDQLVAFLGRDPATSGATGDIALR
jgi:uncharacterized protein (TIGR03086 family)